MPRKKQKLALPPVAVLPEGAQQWLDQVVQGPMTAGAVEDVMRGIKKALIERALQAELSHHLGYAEGEEKPEASANQRNGTSGKTVLTDDESVRNFVFEAHFKPARARAGEGARRTLSSCRKKAPESLPGPSLGYCLRSYVRCWPTRRSGRSWLPGWRRGPCRPSRARACAVVR